MYYTRWQGMFCELIAVGDQSGLSHLHMNTGKGKRTFAIEKDWIRNDEFFGDVKAQIAEYERGDRVTFSLPLNPAGTDFQKQVWKALGQIPYGQVVTYKDIATTVGKPKASRAVGAANGRNPIPLIVPCHRVVGANGKLTGFAHGLKIKEELILHEKLIMVYHRLMAAYGPQGWWPAASDFEMMLGAILVQNTNWTNAALALKNLEDCLSPQKLAALTEDQIADRIRPSGFYKQKAKTIGGFLDWYKGYGYQVEEVKRLDGETLRRELVFIRGIGFETADCMLVYAFGHGHFIADAYGKRILTRLGIEVPQTYEEVRKKVEGALGADLKTYQEFHALLVELGKRHCGPQPKCEYCPLQEQCRHANRTRT